MKPYILSLVLVVFSESCWPAHAMWDEQGGSEGDDKPAPQAKLTTKKAGQCLKGSRNLDQEITYYANQLENRFQSPIAPGVLWWCDGEAIRLLRQSCKEVLVQPPSHQKKVSHSFERFVDASTDQFRCSFWIQFQRLGTWKFKAIYRGHVKKLKASRKD